MTGPVPSQDLRFNEQNFPLSRIIDELQDYDPVMSVAHWEYVCRRAAQEIRRLRAAQPPPAAPFVPDEDC